MLVNVGETSVKSCLELQLNVVGVQVLEAILPVFVFVFTNMTQLENHSV
jgi:hypothetical protein